MNHLLRTAILIVAAMTASALILAGLFGIVRNVNLYGKEGAQFLPTSETRAVVFYPNQRAMQEFPFFEEDYEGAEAIAIFQDFDTALFRKDTEGSVDALGPYLIETSPEKLSSIKEHQELSLDAQQTFERLQAKQQPGTQWTYLPFSSLPHSDNIVSRILKAALTGGSDGIALSYREDGLMIEHPSASISFDKAPKFIPDMPDVFLALALSNANTSYVELQDHLSKEDQVVIEGLLSSSLSSIGEGISFRYDILPLLTQPSSIQISSTGASLNFLISGSMDDDVALQKTLDRLHTAYENSLPTSVITKRVLDKRFSSIDIRHNENVLDQNQFTKNEWVIRDTKLKGKTKGLVTATQGNAFLLSTTLKAISHGIDHLQNTNEQYAAKLTLDLPQVSRLLPDLTSIQKEVTNKFGTGTLQIITNHNGNLRNISIGSSRNPLQLLDLLQ